MASKSAFNSFSFSVASSSSSCSSSYSSSVVSRRKKGCISAKPPKSMNDRIDFYQSLFQHAITKIQAARLLGPPTTFEESKLKVVFNGEEVNKKPLCTSPRAYTLTHCDWTANLTLAVSNSISSEQLQRWRTTLQRDDVVAEWKKVKGEMSLHVHCFVSSANSLQDLAAGFRYYVFKKELPLVLKAMLHGDAALFKEHPELMDTDVIVYFHSNSKKYNRIQCWGPLKEATKRTLDDQSDSLQWAITEKVKRIVIPGTILTALVTIIRMGLYSNCKFFCYELDVDFSGSGTIKVQIEHIRSEIHLTKCILCVSFPVSARGAKDWGMQRILLNFLPSHYKNAIPFSLHRLLKSLDWQL